MERDEPATIIEQLRTLLLSLKPDIKVDLVMRDALKPAIGQRILAEVVAR